MANGESKVQFSLWAVLAFIVAIGFITAQFLNAEQKETRAKQREVVERVTKLETQFDYVTKGIDELKRGQREVVDILIQGKRKQ